MSGAVRLLAFAALLVAAFGAAAFVGRAADPERAEPQASPHGEEADAHAGGDESHAGSADTGPRGLAGAEGDYRLVAVDSELPAGREKAFRFRIVDRENEPVLDFVEEHEREMHLIIVRRDLTGYQHLHPKMGDDGTWIAPVRLPEAGAYRAFADFNAGGEDYTLGTDLHVAGEYRPEPLPHPETTARTDGYEVTLDKDGGTRSFSVRNDGREVTDIEPYLGARGHLVALREGDLAFLHVHPEDGATAGAGINFGVEYPSPGAYRLFLQFKHGGAVRTVAFTEEVGDAHGH
jgi:hypothetical protein